MQMSPLFFLVGAGAATLGLGQTLLPTARAQAAAPILYHVAVRSLAARHTPGGLEITGRIVNTGRRALSYTSVRLIFTDAAGTEIGRAPGYLTAEPLWPGQSAEVRAVLPETAPFHTVTLQLRDAGHPVTVDTAEGFHPLDRRRTTVW